MKAERFPFWVALCLAFFLVAHTLVAEEGQNIIHLSQRVLQSAEARFGPTASTRLLSWTKLIADNQNKSESDKMKLVNDFFNQIPFVSDMEHWGKPDYWATPVEMLASNGGDSEDFAIGKYFSLLALGFNMDKLRITYVKAINLPPSDQTHMVLTYYSTPDAMPVVLDNLDGKIKPANERNDLVPIYSFNGDGLWLAKERSSSRFVRSSSRFAGSSNSMIWIEMNSRMGNEFSE